MPAARRAGLGGGWAARALSRPGVDIQSVASLIAYAGLGPMLAGLVIVAANGLGNVSRATALAVLIRYAAVSLSFLAGIRWGMAMRLGSAREEVVAIMLAPLPVLLAWIATLLPAPIALGLLAACFAGQGAWDVWTADRGRMPSWYGALRLRLTGAAVAILVLTLFALMR